MNDCILIAGMHRSGTSVLAGALQHFGVDFGDQLLPSKEGENDLGFFEDYEILALNDGYLQAIHSIWDDVRLLEYGSDNPISNDYKEQLYLVLSKKFSDSLLWCVKDPRLCLLMPLWIDVLKEMGVKPKIIIPFRHPYEIARSLKRRNGFSFEKSALLILKYYLSSEKNTRDYERIFVSYDSLLNRQEQFFHELGKKFSIHWPIQTGVNISDFLKPDLKHFNFITDDELSIFGRFKEDMVELGMLLEKVEGQSGNNMLVEFDQIEKNSNSLSEKFDPMIINELMNLRVEVSCLIDHYNHIRQLPVEIRNIQKLFNTLHEQIEEQKVQIEERTDWIKMIDKELHNNRDLLLQIKTRQERPKLWINQVVLLVRQGVKHPYKVIPWVYRRISNQLVRKRIKENSLLKTVEQRKQNAVDQRELLSSIKFLKHENPILSIIIPVYNDIEYTLGCLFSLSKLNDSVSYEIIIVDDASPEIDTTILSSLDNILCVKNEKNLGFVGTCNRGAEFAHGKYLLFLNNDTLVHQECLDKMIGTFTDFPDAGMVGGKLVYPDGRLQEAGGIVWKDGSAWNYGRLKDPDAPEFNYAREVDYCSGALLMVPNDIFIKLKGFDSHYSPAYYEDTDLAFRVRLLGKKPYYQPAAVITHFEGVTCGTDTGSGVKQYQVVNQEKFYQRWKETLLSHRQNGELPEMECDRNVQKRVLILDHRMLTPDQDSGSVRMFNIFRVMQGLGYKVTFIPDNFYAESPYTLQLQEIGIEVIYTPFYSSAKGYLEKYGYLFDVCILSRLFVTAKNISHVRTLCPQAKIIYDTVDLHFLREIRQAELTKNSKTYQQAIKTRDHELSLMEMADVTIVVSPYEKELLKDIDDKLNIHVVSNIHAIHKCKNKYEEREDILFIGGFEHTPNVDAVKWFVSDVLPVIKKLIPEICFHIIGSKPSKEIQSMVSSEDNIFVHGYVKDVTSFFENIKLTVAPLRYGAGVKGKVNQSLSYGVPCVATDIASEGMSLTHKHDIYVANTAEEFAEGVIKVYREKELWGRLSKGGFGNIDKYFSFEAARNSLIECL